MKETREMLETILSQLEGKAVYINNEKLEEKKPKGKVMSFIVRIINGIRWRARLVFKRQ